MSKSRRPANPITEEECQTALDNLTAVMTEDFVSPPKAVAPSAVQLLFRRGIVPTTGRASYVLARLVEIGAIEPIKHSHSYKVNRKTLTVGRTPIIPAATQEAYEETIRRLNAKLANQERQFQRQMDAASTKLSETQNLLVAANNLNERLEAERADLMGQLVKLDEPVEPTSDIKRIMERELNN